MVYFIGAGPGDPDLITVKGKRVIEEADRIIYAGSLVNPQILEGAKPEARIYNSASMALPQVIAVMEQAEQEGKMTARVHTGYPSLYGAVREQMTELEKRRIQYEVIPGVSSFLAAGAALKREYTLPGVSQSVILTRMEGRTPVPEKESLEELAKHGSTMVIFLSVGQIRELCRRLKKGAQEKRRKKRGAQKRGAQKRGAQKKGSAKKGERKKRRGAKKEKTLDRAVRPAENGRSKNTVERTGWTLWEQNGFCFIL